MKSLHLKTLRGKIQDRLCELTQPIRIVPVDRPIDSCLHVEPYDFSVVNSMIVLHCPPTATIIEVNSPEDIVHGKCEFVVNKAIQQKATMEACSAENLLLTMKVLFKEEEMSQKMNFMVNKGKRRMSPKRLHSLVHLYVKNFDRRFD